MDATLITPMTTLETVVHDSRPGSALAKLARQWLNDHCPYAYYFRNVSLAHVNGALVLEGQVPTYYLKQVLQAVLGRMPQVACIDNRVDVVSSAGLSSVRPR